MNDDAPASRRGRRRAIDAVRLLLVLAAIGLGSAAIARESDGFVLALRAIGLDRAALAGGLIVLGLVASGSAWHSGVDALAGNLPRRSARRVFYVSQLGKYLPGSVWPILAQVDAARRYGLDIAQMGVASLLFVGLHVLTGLVVVTVLLPWAAPDLLEQYPWIWLLIPPTFIALTPPVLGCLLRIAGRVIRRGSLAATQLSWSAVLRPAGWLLVTWAAYGIAATAVVRPLAPTSNLLAVAAVAAGGFALSWVVGVLFLPAPAGVGAREVVLVLALTPLTGATAATSVAIVLRVLHTAGDLGLAAMARVRDRAPNRTTDRGVWDR